MSYGLIYTIQFASLHKEACLVEIEKENYTGASTELIASESPFEVEIEDDDFLYIPTRFSTARIRVVGSDYLQELYSTAYQQYRVTFKREGIVTWCGFVKPEVYTQDYSSEKFELEIECISAMSSLEYINYKQEGTAGKIFVSIWDLLKKCVVLSRGPYAEVFIPHVYAKDASSYAAGANVLEDMTVSEQDFFDEDGEPMKMKEILEEICKLLNWTCTDYLGVLYFVDVDYTGDYNVYPLSFTTPNRVAQKSLNVQQIGFAGADHSFDYIAGYNKVKVKTSNYPIADSLFGEVKFNKMEVLATCHELDKPQNPTKHFIKKYLYDTNIDMRAYKVNAGNVEEVDIRNYKNSTNELNGLLGARFVQTCIYDPRDSAMSEYSFTDSIQIRTKNEKNDLCTTAGADGITLTAFKCADAKAFPPGVFCISGNVIPFYKDISMSLLNEEETARDRIVSMTVRVGNKYYGRSSDTGKYWTTGKRYFSVANEAGKGFRNFTNTKKADMPYKGLSGYILTIDEMLIGDFEISINIQNGRREAESIVGYYLKDFKIVYQKPDDTVDKEDSNSDRYYENIVNDRYINELDEIEFKISSYNNDGACYSKVMLGSNYLTDNLYSSIVGKAVRPEEHLIQRIINRYSATHIKLTQVIKETQDLTPITRLSDNSKVSSIFINAGGSIDYKSGQFKCVMIEV